jgi:hypothetical protein
VIKLNAVFIAISVSVKRRISFGTGTGGNVAHGNAGWQFDAMHGG